MGSFADQVFFEPDFIVGTHTTTLEAMRTGDPDLAEQAVDAYMLEIGETIARALDQQKSTDGQQTEPA